MCHVASTSQRSLHDAVVNSTMQTECINRIKERLASARVTFESCTLAVMTGSHMTPKI